MTLDKICKTDLRGNHYWVIAEDSIGAKVIVCVNCNERYIKGEKWTDMYFTSGGKSK